MIKKEELKDSLENLETLRRLCTKDCTNDETMSLKKFYMNKYGNYMAARIGSVLFSEFLFMFFIMNTGVDRLWNVFAYGETVAYSILWGSGGIYLAQMLIRVIRDTYDLKLALEAGKVKCNDVRITYNGFDYDKKNKSSKMRLYTKGRKNELISFFTSKKASKKAHKNRICLVSNIDNDDQKGSEITVYAIDDRKKDLFLMVKNKKIMDSADKVLKEALMYKMSLNKVKLNMMLGRYNTKPKKDKKNKKK